MSPFSPTLLRKVLGDICRGYSIVSSDKTGKRLAAPVYIKHLTQHDQTDVDDYYETELARARRKGIPSENDKRKWLEVKGLWSNRDESAIAIHRDYVKNLELTKSKAWIKSQIEQQETALAVERKALADMVARKEGLFGLTDEKVASQKMQFYYIHLSFYGDPSLCHRLYDMPTMNEMDEEESYALLTHYIEFVNRFDSSILRRLAVSPVFTNSLQLCGDNVSQFFGKPIVSLSFYQSNLLNYGLYFKSLLAHENLPPDIRDDPDRIEEHITKGHAAKAALKTNLEGNVSTGVVGATSEDFKSQGFHEDKEGRHMQRPPVGA